MSTKSQPFRVTTLEAAIQDYWSVSYACNYPKAVAMTTSEALRRVTTCEDLCMPKSWRIKRLAHNLKFDIIEGSSQWRQSNRTPQKQPQIISLSTRSIMT